ncbi:hypothetical protein HP548_07580 [Paenibacillus taichungensis]|uniref:Spore coat protein D n=1 Tax=Paenibacillus taichungensis TaxID=484184 RepID=A0ABX2MIB3_9BACL|nr:hypothetical protein [Paenibacillus taichungensis]MDR9745162.1 hypothetical protein [Paenibacillus taichungensis]NUU53939.1 hypothetical protein [Paenibacillus taichungensis]
MYIIVHSLPAPLGAINGRLPDCPLVHALHPLKDVNMPSDNHLTGALHSGHVIPASTCPGSLSCMDSGYSPDHGYSSFQFIAIIIQIKLCFGNLLRAFPNGGPACDRGSRHLVEKDVTMLYR